MSFSIKIKATPALSTKIIKGLFVVLFILGLGITPGLAADETSESGTFSFLARLTSSFFHIEELDGTTTGGRLSGTMSITQTSGSPFEIDDHYVDCIVFIKKRKDSKDIQGETPCLVQHPKTGDKMYTQSTRNVGDLKTGGPGKTYITGGTGRYEGIVGECDYKVNYLNPSLSVTRADCTWEKRVQ